MALPPRASSVPLHAGEGGTFLAQAAVSLPWTRHRSSRGGGCSPPAPAQPHPLMGSSSAGVSQQVARTSPRALTERWMNNGKASEESPEPPRAWKCLESHPHVPRHQAHWSSGGRRVQAGGALLGEATCAPVRTARLRGTPQEARNPRTSAAGKAASCFGPVSRKAAKVRGRPRSLAGTAPGGDKPGLPDSTALCLRRTSVPDG